MNNKIKNLRCITDKRLTRLRQLFPFTIHPTPFRKTVVAVVRCEMTDGTRNAKGILTMLVDDGWGRNKDKFSTMRSLGRGILGSCRRGSKGLLTTESLAMRTFKAIAFNGDTSYDNIEKGIRRRRGIEIGRAIKMVLGALGE